MLSTVQTLHSIYGTVWGVYCFHSMSQDPLKAFLAKVEADAALQEMLKTAANPEAVVGIAKEAGFEISEESLMALRELSDEELEQAAGGMFGSGGLFASGFPSTAGAAWTSTVKLPGISDNTQNDFGVTFR
jgi:hypothetical protein